MKNNDIKVGDYVVSLMPTLGVLPLFLEGAYKTCLVVKTFDFIFFKVYLLRNTIIWTNSIGIANGEKSTYYKHKLGFQIKEKV